MSKPIEHHVIILDKATNYQNKHYKVTHQSRNVYETTKLPYAPTRLVVWDNTGRPNPFKGAKLGDKIRDQAVNDYFLQWRPNAVTAKWFDPKNEPTDEPVTILLSPESSAMCADTSMNTGQPGSGQVFAAGKLGDNDTATLNYPDGTTREVLLHLPPHRNGHGYATFVK